MSRLQLRAWSICFVSLALLTSGSSSSLILAQEDNDPVGPGKPAAPAEQRADQVMASPADDAAAESAIRKTLEKPTSMEFIETPLQEAVDYLKDLHQIEIQLDAKALEAEGDGSDTPVTRTLKGISLESALRILLAQYDLTFVVDKGVLLITTPAAVANMVEIRVYDVHDLLKEGDVQELSQILRLALNLPPSAKPGGIATARTGQRQHASTEGGSFPLVQTYPAAPQIPVAVAIPTTGSAILPYGNLIVVRASIVEHEAITELLENMRSAMRQAGQ